MKQGVTIREVAQRAGVSVATVSRVLNDNHPVSKETRAQVLEAVAALNYHTNVMARSLRGYRSKIIAVVTPDIANDFFMYVVKGIETAFDKTDFCLLIASTNGDAEAEDRLLSTLIERHVDGLVIASASTNADKINDCIDRGIYTVLIDRQVEGAQASSIVCNNAAATQGLIGLLLEAGHRDIGIINVSLRNAVGVARQQGYFDALRQAGLPVCDAYVSSPNFTVEDGREAVSRMLALPKPPTALFCANNIMTEAALSVLDEQGLRVGEDMSLVAFGTLSINRFHHPTITVAQHDGMEMGMLAGDMLRRQLSGEDDALRDITLEVHINKGESIKAI